MEKVYLLTEEEFEQIRNSRNKIAAMVGKINCRIGNDNLHNQHAGVPMWLAGISTELGTIRKVLEGGGK